MTRGIRTYSREELNLPLQWWRGLIGAYWTTRLNTGAFLTFGVRKYSGEVLNSREIMSLFEVVEGLDKGLMTAWSPNAHRRAAPRSPGGCMWTAHRSPRRDPAGGPCRKTCTWGESAYSQ
eukprot:6108877-Pyramimonas_sp.AAC.3